MAIMLTGLADWCREAGVRVKEYPGWQTRVRGGGPYQSMPLGVFWHHTASPPTWDGAKDADYIAKYSDVAPVSNLYIDRTGLVWVIAAGPTNTNGKGGPMQFSRGTIPLDGANTRAIGIEMGNNGVGEQWPCPQVDAAFAVSNICNKKCGNLPTDIASHQAWAPTRKIDPATNNVAGPWVPRSVNRNGTWNLDDMRSEAVKRCNTGPIPEDDDEMMFDGLWNFEGHSAVYALYKTGTKTWMLDPPHLAAMQNLMRLHGANDVQLSIRTSNDPGMFRAFGPVIGPCPPGVDNWGVPQ